MVATTIPADYALCLDQTKTVDLLHCAAIFGLTVTESTLEIPFFDRIYRFSPGHIVDLHGNSPTDAVGLLLCKYLLGCPSQTIDPGRRITFRELKGAGPLVSSFASNTLKLINATFSGDVKALEHASHKLKGRTIPVHPNYDLCVAFDALPNIPVFLQFNAADEQFPAQCGLLFNQSAEAFLDMQSLFIVGTYLAGGLVRYQSKTPSI